MGENHPSYDDLRAQIVCLEEELEDLREALEEKCEELQDAEEEIECLRMEVLELTNSALEDG